MTLAAISLKQHVGGQYTVTHEIGIRMVDSDFDV